MLKWIPVHTYTIHTLGKGKFASMSSRTTAGVSRPHVAVIGGGFCGFAAAYELGRRGVRATVLERGAEVGGLAGSFAAGGERLEKFYHHWFTGDVRRRLAGQE